MKPKNEAYHKNVIVPKVWEEIDRSHYLVTEEVSNYIRKLEDKLKLAEAVIDPAIEILPDTYDKEIDAYLNFK